MKTFIYHDSCDSDGRNRVEIKTPIIQTLGKQPPQEYQYVVLRPNVMTASWSHDHMPMDERVVIHKMAFETVRFSTMKWIEERRDGNISMGYYARVDSYCQIPQGANIEHTIQYEKGNDIYGYLNTVPLRGAHIARLQEKISDMELKLASLSTRPILPEEQLRAMRADWLDSRNHHDSMPKRLKEFDYFENDNDFRVE